MDSFELSLPAKVVFGVGCVSKLGAEVKLATTRVLLVLGGNPGRTQAAQDSLAQAGVDATAFTVKGEPTLQVVRAGARKGREFACQGVVAVGGGSVMDAGKAIAAMMANSGDLLDYLEVIGGGRALDNPPVFFAAVPTTAGTGTEATRNAVLTSVEHKVKVSLRHPSLVPKVALLDPQLTVTLPPEITATTGMDALCQLIEVFTCKTPNPFTDSLCLEGLQMAARSLRKAFRDGSDLAARGDMLLAAHFSGIALANAKLGAVHGFAAPLGGMYDAPHGALCAALLPAVLAVNQKALGRAGSSALQRYGVIAALLTGNPSAKPRELVEYCDALRGELGIPRLADLGVEKKDFGALCEKAAKSSSMKGNPADLSGAELMEILEMAY